MEDRAKRGKMGEGWGGMLGKPRGVKVYLAAKKFLRTGPQRAGFLPSSPRRGYIHVDKLVTFLKARENSSDVPPARGNFGDSTFNTRTQTHRPIPTPPPPPPLHRTAHPPPIRRGGNSDRIIQHGNPGGRGGGG